jgi:hypothetical protein
MTGTASTAYQRAFERQITILIGGQGSGKSELAILWVQRLVSIGRAPVTLVDLDLFKPLFRSREAAGELQAMGVRVVLSSLPAGYIPSPPQTVVGELGSGAAWMVIDVGGDATGARVLRSLRSCLDGRDVNLLSVLNTKRPRTRDVESACAELRGIEAESGLRLTGLVSNTHLIDDTDLPMIEEGLAVARAVANRLGIDLIGVMAPEALAAGVRVPDDTELFSVRRMLNPPWLREGATTP